MPTGPGKVFTSDYQPAQIKREVRLTGRQDMFVRRYMQCFNAREAALFAGYSENVAMSASIRLLRKPIIAAEVERRKVEMLMSTEEMKIRLAAQARAEYAEYYNADGTVDLEGLLADGKGHLIKTIKRAKDGYLEITWHDAQTALSTLAKIDGLFTETVNNTGKVTIQVNYGKRPLNDTDPEDLEADE